MSIIFTPSSTSSMYGDPYLSSISEHILTPISPFQPLTLNINEFSKPLIGVYETIDTNPEVRRKMAKYYYDMVRDKWLLDELNDVLNYVVVRDGKVSLIKNLSEYSPNNISKDTDDIAEKKVDFIEKELFTRNSLIEVLNKFTNETKTKWVDLPKNEYYLREMVKEYIIRKIRKQLKGEKGDKGQKGGHHQLGACCMPFAVGTFGTPGYKVYTHFANSSKAVSPFHEVPLWSVVNKEVNMVYEIPKGTNIKLEISKKEPWNPIMHDIKDAKIRVVGMPYPAHYGALPQTWEAPDYVDPYTKKRGDNDPVDVFDLADTEVTPGQVRPVRVLGVFGMIDNGETDWKVAAIDVNSNPNINTLEDVEKHMPGKLNALFTFLRDYKKSDGKPENTFAFEGKVQNREFALGIINQTHEEWKKLVAGKTNAKDIWIPTKNLGFKLEHEK